MIGLGLAVLVGGPFFAFVQIRKMAAAVSQDAVDMLGFGVVPGMIIAMYAVYGLPLLIGGFVLLRRARTEQNA